MRLPLLTDNPVERLDEDRFGFQPYIKELDTLIAMAEPLPITVGIFGSWGSGKSSFLRMWMSLIEDCQPCSTIWFNPWKYDKKVEVWAALIQSILGALQERSSSPERIARLLRHITWLTLRGGISRGLELTTAGVLTHDTVEHTLDAIANQDAEFYRFANEYERSFMQAVKDSVGEDGRLVVFVDDLDRCTPEAALAVLEALKLFIGDARCVFILAMDVDVVAAAADQKLGGRGPFTGAAYLEKIIQLPFFLPNVGFETLRMSVSQNVGELAESAAFWELVQIGFESNPRRVKRYINVLNLATAILKLDVSAEGMKKRLQLAELLIIRSEHREFFRYLLKNPGAWWTLEASIIFSADGAPAVKLGPEDINLQRFAEDDALIRLLATQPTKSAEYPPAASAEETERMLSTVRLAAGPVEEMR